MRKARFLLTEDIAHVPSRVASGFLLDIYGYGPYIRTETPQRTKTPEERFREDLLAHNIQEGTGEYLRSACEHGQLQAVLATLANPLVTEEIINSSDKWGNTAFYIACDRIHETCAIALLGDKRVDANKCDILGKSPLDLVYQKTLIKIMKKWIESGRVLHDPRLHYSHSDFFRRLYPEVDEMDKLLAEHFRDKKE